MRRVTLGGVLGWCLLVPWATAWGDDWRPARSAPPAARAKGVQLGKPVRASTNDAAPSFSLASTRSAAPTAPGVSQVGLELPRTIVRGQSPVGSEEQFNCGVVSEGVPPPPPTPPPGGGWWEGIWVGGPQQSFNTLIGGPITYSCDRAFESFISPISNPFFFEDPRSSTEIRPIFMYQRIPGKTRTTVNLKNGSASMFSGGNIEYFGVQGRLAFNERFSIGIYNLGGIATQPNGIGDDFGDNVGLAQLQLGPKFTFYRDDVTGTIMAFGLNFEIPIGPSNLAQDTGSGAVTPYFSIAQQFAQNWHFMGSVGYRFRFDDERTASLFTSAHLDYGFYNRVFPLVELNWYYYASNGNTRDADFEGQDLFNFGSNNATGNVLTLAAGVRFKFTENVLGGIVYEFPLLNRDDLLSYRITADMIFRF